MYLIAKNTISWIETDLKIPIFHKITCQVVIRQFVVGQLPLDLTW